MTAESECSDVENDFRDIQRYVGKIIRTFKDSKFSLAVASQMTYDENTHFNENNVI
jgi:hypothetical protein